MGSGDWNDGMDKVGEHGKGESIWLAFFLYAVLTRFSEIARLHKDEAFAAECLGAARKLSANIEKNGWDGEWYRRAYFDDGSPLGSAGNAECRIDSISQSWSVLSGAGTPERSHKGMESADKYLVRRDTALIQLLDPPFDKSDLNPGYIKGYVPGVRENGGQYTHAAIWLTMAFAAMGDRARAWELFNMINPIHHGSTPQGVATYKVEPYVVAADVYSISLHKGRGGWTWYTGSAGWMYQLLSESLLGLVREGNSLRFMPCLPVEWEAFVIHYRYMDTVYHVKFVRGAAGAAQVPATGQTASMSISLDGVVQAGDKIPLADDRVEHVVEVKMGG
jgi:cellobiose phosphorylase